MHAVSIKALYKEWRLYIKFEINHTIWTNTKPLTGKIFLCTIFL